MQVQRMLNVENAARHSDLDGLVRGQAIYTAGRKEVLRVMSSIQDL